MIFVTVGAQMPFDRLVRSVDRWAGNNPQVEVFAQIGKTKMRPRHLTWEAFLTPEQFRRRCAQATAIISHAGVGAILTALDLGRPILVMPRRADLRETRSDHQFATARYFVSLRYVTAAYDESELESKLNQLHELPVPERISQEASPELVESIRSFIEQID